MTALALALAYLGTLLFVGMQIERRDAFRSNVRDVVSGLKDRVSTLEARASDWNDAAEYVENDRLRRGVTTRRQA